MSEVLRLSAERITSLQKLIQVEVVSALVVAAAFKSVGGDSGKGSITRFVSR